MLEREQEMLKIIDQKNEQLLAEEVCISVVLEMMRQWMVDW